MSSLPTGISSPKVDYALDHSSRELDRLTFQGTVFVPHTRQLLMEAGLTAGMRVLDVGSGSGDVSFLAADLVGSNGYVLGVDRSPAAVERARSRAYRRNLTNVSFELGDPAAMHFDGLFDAIIGRFVSHVSGRSRGESGKDCATSSSGWLGCISRSGLHRMPLLARRSCFRRSSSVACRRIAQQRSATRTWRRLGHITKQGSSMLRFLLVEAAQVTVRSLPEWRSQYHRVIDWASCSL